MPSLIFRKGLDLKGAVAGMLAENYHSSVIDRIKEANYTYEAGRLTVHLAREFGFCYGVDRAVDYAYQTRQRFPERRVYLTGEIIHNPHVNEKLRAMGIRFLSDPSDPIDNLRPTDVVILPAFGVTTSLLQRLDRIGCTLIDTTCGSVLNVWKNVRRYAEGGYTSVIHGKVVARGDAGDGVAGRRVRRPLPGGIRRRRDRCWSASTSAPAAIATRSWHVLAAPSSAGFDPERDLDRIGLANQTTMLMSESLAVGEMLRAAMVDRWGETRSGGALSGVRHHLQRHAGPAGRGRGAAARASDRSDGRHRRLQQQQHRQPGTHVRRGAPDLPRRGSRLPGVERGNPAPAGRREGGNRCPGLAARVPVRCASASRPAPRLPTTWSARSSRSSKHFAAERASLCGHPGGPADPCRREGAGPARRACPRLCSRLRAVRRLQAGHLRTDHRLLAHARRRFRNRMRLVDIGLTVEGRTQVMAIITSERNLRELGTYKEIARSLALTRDGARSLSDDQARRLARRGKAVVWMDFGLHSSEVAHAQTAPLVAFKAVTDGSDEMKAIRDNVIFLLVPNMNPDGTTMVADWYMKHVGKPWERPAAGALAPCTSGTTTTATGSCSPSRRRKTVARQLYEEWFPQIVYNQHQTGALPRPHLRAAVRRSDEPEHPAAGDARHQHWSATR